MIDVTSWKLTMSGEHYAPFSTGQAAIYHFKDLFQITFPLKYRIQLYYIDDLLMIDGYKTMKFKQRTILGHDAYDYVTGFFPIVELNVKIDLNFFFVIEQRGDVVIPMGFKRKEALAYIERISKLLIFS